MRICKISVPSCKRAGTPCCADCPEKDCLSRCLNHPKRCGCWAENTPEKLHMGRAYDWNQMALLYEQGLTLAQIAARLKCKPHTVGNALKKMGVTKRGQA